MKIDSLEVNTHSHTNTFSNNFYCTNISISIYPKVTFRLSSPLCPFLYIVYYKLVFFYNTLYQLQSINYLLRFFFLLSPRFYWVYFHVLSPYSTNYSIYKITNLACTHTEKDIQSFSTFTFCRTIFQYFVLLYGYMVHTI